MRCIAYLLRHFETSNVCATSALSKTGRSAPSRRERSFASSSAGSRMSARAIITCQLARLRTSTFPKRSYMLPRSATTVRIRMRFFSESR